ncbi:hypothetical protein D3C80_1468850 [compost metagenome]
MLPVTGRDLHHGLADTARRAGVQHGGGQFEFGTRLCRAQLVHGLAFTRESAQFGQLQETFEVRIQRHCNSSIGNKPSRARPGTAGSVGGRGSALQQRQDRAQEVRVAEDLVVPGNDLLILLAACNGALESCALLLAGPPAMGLRNGCRQRPLLQ